MPFATVPRRRLLVVAGVALLAAIGAAMVLARSSADRPIAGLEVTWGGSEGHPSCVYDPEDHTVDAKLKVEGEVPRPETLTVTVTAYADENTSEPVGAGSRSVRVQGTEHLTLHVTFPVEAPPVVDIDGETACRLSVRHDNQDGAAVS